ncbi:HpcH/HpaI aldolase/citrate lyase family protein [Roseomonas sp. 18066]|uniref:HpcH/HpaI aldolase family protein n=1 Tax=Roseomonas sp. 18066 TaxID=2681412 RepID=UPI00190F4A4E|nr:aldolase/citrate lyase family protein [Roseomonas sp. 18066]
MRGTRLHRMLASGDCALNGWSAIPSPFLAEAMAHQGFDSITLDLQHGLISFDAALAMLQAISTTDVTPLARVAGLEPPAIMKLLDAGAMGIICPLIDNAAQAAAFVSACRYPPFGGRSFGPTRAQLYAGRDYVAKANETILTFAMIETVEGFDNVDAILAVPGLDGVYIGPSDLSFTHGHDPVTGPEQAEMLARIDAIRDAARRAGKKVAMHSSAIDYCVAMWGRGFDMVTAPNDNRLFGIGTQQLMTALDRKAAAPAPRAGY